MGFLGGLFGIASSAMTNAANARAQDSANRTNIKIAQMNNEYNERMLQKQMDYNTDMWNKQNEYNSAENQAQRYRDAGLNPTMMMQGQSAGIAQSAQGVNTPSATPVQVQPNRYDFSQVGQSIQYMLDYKLAQQKNMADVNLLQEQAKGFQIENQYKAQDLLSKIYDNWQSGALKGSQRQLNQIEALFKGDLMQSQIGLNKSSANYNAMAAGNQAMMSLLNYKEFQRFDKKSQLELSNIAAEIGVKMAQKGYLTAQEKLSIEQRFDVMETAKGKKLDNKLKSATMQYLINTAKNNQYGNNAYSWANEFTGRLHKLFK